jgi:hypothetical protein
MTLQYSHHYSPWSSSVCQIIYYFACPTCRIIWDFPLMHNYIDGPPLLEIPFRCSNCNRQGEAFAESKTGMVEEIKNALAANEFDRIKDLLTRNGDLPGLFRIKLKDSYLSMRVLAWEAGGPGPLSKESPTGWPSEEEFVHQSDRIFRVIDSWWQDEPFTIEILNNRIDQRMDNLVNSSIEIPQKHSAAYNDFLDSLNIGKKKEKLTTERMLRNVLPPLPIDILRASLANNMWPWVFASEARILFIEEDKAFNKQNYQETLLLTVIKARGGDLTALRNIIAWNYVWMTCPWVKELVNKRSYDFDFCEMLKDALSNRPGYFHITQKPTEKIIEQVNVMQFLHDRFRAKLKDIDKFFENAFTDKYGDQDYENIKKLRKKHLRK